MAETDGRGDYSPHQDAISQLISFATLGYDKRWRSRLVDEIGQLDGLKVADIATGSGTTALMIASRCKSCDVTGIDFDGQLLQMAKARSRGVKNVTYLLGGMDYFKTGDGEFDAAVSSFTIGNFNDPVKAIEEMHRILKPGGKLLILDINRLHNSVLRSFWNLNYSLRVVPYLNASRPSEFNSFFDIRKIQVDKDNLADMLKTLGFDVEKVRKMGWGAAFIIVATKR